MLLKHVFKVSSDTNQISIILPRVFQTETNTKQQQKVFKHIPLGLSSHQGKSCVRVCNTFVSPKLQLTFLNRQQHVISKVVVTPDYPPYPKPVSLRGMRLRRRNLVMWLISWNIWKGLFPQSYESIGMNFHNRKLDTVLLVVKISL